MAKPHLMFDPNKFGDVVERSKTDPTVSARSRTLVVALFKMDRLQLWFGQLSPFLRKTASWFLAFSVQICITFLVQTILGVSLLHQWQLMGVVGLLALVLAMVVWFARLTLLRAMHDVFEKSIESATEDDIRAGRFQPSTNVVPFHRPTGGSEEPPTYC